MPEILCKRGKNQWYYTSVEEWENSFKRTLETPFKRFLTLSFNCDTLPHQKTLTRLGNTSHEKTAPYIAGLLLWKGYEMKKYIPLDFDEKGKVILGREKNTPTPNGTIPAIFIPGGSDENKQGLKSISIIPAITTDPALDSFTIYWEDLTDEEKQSGNIERTFACPSQLFIDNEYTVTITPTETWGVDDGDRQPVAGEAVSIASYSHESGGNILLQFTLGAYNIETQTEGFNLEIRFVDNDPK